MFPTECGFRRIARAQSAKDGNRPAFLPKRPGRGAFDRGGAKTTAQICLSRFVPAFSVGKPHFSDSPGNSCCSSSFTRLDPTLAGMLEQFGLMIHLDLSGAVLLKNPPMQIVQAAQLHG